MHRCEVESFEGFLISSVLQLLIREGEDECSASLHGILERLQLAYEQIFESFGS